MVQNLLPNTRYEFLVRLHVDQMSSPWSTVVYHQTQQAGNTFDISVASYRHYYVVESNLMTESFLVNFSVTVVDDEHNCSVYST